VSLNLSENKMLNHTDSIARRLWYPSARLATTFPWSMGRLSKTYGVALVCFVIGTLLPLLLLLGPGLIPSSFQLSYLEMVDAVLSSRTGYAGLVIVSFVTGFGAEVWYLNRSLRQEGLSLSSALALNAKALNDSIFAVLWRGGVAFVLIMAVNLLVDLLPLPAVHDPFAELLKSFSGWPQLALVVMAISGPVFEEIVFRGFLFNMIRSSLHRNSRAIGTGHADLIAVAVSAAMFALMHFNLSGFLAYFVVGSVLAESYRRSGSLWVPITAHCLNNAVGVALILLS